MKKIIENTAYSYGRFIGTHPKTMVLVLIILTIIGQYGNSLLTMTVEDNEDMLPGHYAQIKAMNVMGDEFGGVDSGNIVLEISPATSESDEVRDLRDPKALRYMDLLAQRAKSLDIVVGATSLADIAKEDGRIPRTPSSVNANIAKDPSYATYLLEDYSMALVKLDFISSMQEEDAYSDLEQVLASTPAPPGITSALNGAFAISTAMRRSMQDDMSSTSQASMIGILFLIIILFRSIRYGLTSLSAIIFGLIWSFGLMGLMGMSISNTTSGASSMIMGIGIDFGIQVTSRFRIELKKRGISEAMAETIRVVSIPMGTTTLAALIGFQAMSIPNLTVCSLFLSEIGV